MEDHELIPLADEVEPEEESPYRRRQKNVEVRRGQFSRRVRRYLLWTLFVFFVLLPAGYGGYRVAIFVLSSPRFRLNSAEDIAVNGNHFATREEILSAMNFPPARATGAGPGANIFLLSLDEQRRQVESVHWVRSATLSRAFPHRLTVYVAERVPIAYLNVNGQVKLVDSEGVLLEKPEKGIFDFPVLTGLDLSSGAAERQLRLALYQEFLREVGGEVPSSGWLISEVDLSESDDLKALLVRGRETLQVHFGQSDFLERFRNFLALWPEVSKTKVKVDSVDLRYRNQIVVNPMAGPTRTSPGLKAAPQPDSRKE